MNAELGTAALAAAFAASVIGAGCAAVAATRRDVRWMRGARALVATVLIGTLAAAGVLEYAILTHDFSIAYVANNGSHATPTLFAVASLWAALEGSILLWALILAAHLGFAAYRWRRLGNDPLIMWALSVGMAAAAFFLGLMLGPANPFRTLAAELVPLDGRGPNPLLQNHPMMAFHPPLLYLGYVGFTIPFALAIAALVTGRVGEQWLRLTRRATLLAWGCLTGGIVLGAWWSYAVLGWGGYWAWDPVENAALIPWFTATAYLHSVVVQERRGMLRVWNLSLLISTYCLTILGTFLTRSGVVNSVHAFTQSAVGPALLAYLTVAAVLGLGLLAWRGDRLRAPARIDSALSREAAFLGNNLLLTALAVLVVAGTVFPLVAELIWNEQLSVGEPYFDRLGAPLGMALLVLITLAPLLPYRVADPAVLRRRVRWPAAAAAVTAAAAGLGGATGLTPVLTFSLAAAAAVSIVQTFGSAARARMSARDEHAPVAFMRLVAGNRRHYGGLVVHLGVVVVAVALAASQSYVTRAEPRLAPGDSATVAGYTVTYLGTETRTSPQKVLLAARLQVDRDGDPIGVYEPSLATFGGSGDAIGTPAVRPGLVDDLYLTLISSPDASGTVTVGVFVNPLVSWLWGGGLVMVLGAVVAGWPARRPRQARPTGQVPPPQRTASPALAGSPR